jgi:hypothetical protein
MTDDEPTQAEADDVMGAAVALMRAARACDVEGGDLILASVDLTYLAAWLAGLANSLGAAAYGDQEWQAALVRWQPGMRLGDRLDPLDPPPATPEA